MNHIKTKIGFKPNRNTDDFLFWEGMQVVRTKYVSQLDDVYTLIFKRELNPFLKFIKSRFPHPDYEMYANMSFMNIHFYNLMQKFTGNLFWEKNDVKELLLTKLWHSYLYLSTGNSLDDDNEYRSFLIDINSFITRFESVLEFNGIDNPMIVITFENNFLNEDDYEVILNDFSEITSNFEDIPSYKLPYAGNQDFNVLALFR